MYAILQLASRGRKEFFLKSNLPFCKDRSASADASQMSVISEQWFSSQLCDGESMASPLSSNFMDPCLLHTEPIGKCNSPGTDHCSQSKLISSQFINNLFRNSHIPSFVLTDGHLAKAYKTVTVQLEMSHVCRSAKED